MHETPEEMERLDGARMRHLRARPVLGATHLPGEELAVSVHGRAELFVLDGSEGAELLRAMVAFYEPKQGAAFEESMRQADALGARIVPRRCSRSTWTRRPQG